jgi:hypothetical protein
MVGLSRKIRHTGHVCRRNYKQRFDVILASFFFCSLTFPLLQIPTTLK